MLKIIISDIGFCKINKIQKVIYLAQEFIQIPRTVLTFLLRSF